jgi:hypothetical protein
LRAEGVPPEEAAEKASAAGHRRVPAERGEGRLEHDGLDPRQRAFTVGDEGKRDSFSSQGGRTRVQA